MLSLIGWATDSAAHCTAISIGLPQKGDGSPWLIWGNFMSRAGFGYG